MKLLRYGPPGRERPAMLDADGQVMSRCRLFGENKAIVCSFPAG